jgi:hypothetical protein
MHDWPADPDEIPSPRLVAAWLILGTLPTERVPLWAAHWLAAGYDGQALAELAGLHGDDPHEVRDLLGPALAECSASTPGGGQAAAGERERAAAMVAFTAIARLQISGRASDGSSTRSSRSQSRTSTTPSPACRSDSYSPLTTNGEPAGDAQTNSCVQSSGKPASPSSMQPAADRATGITRGGSRRDQFELT